MEDFGSSRQDREVDIGIAGGGMKRYTIVGLLMLVVAFVIGTMVHGGVEGSRADRLAKDIGGGVTGRDLLSLKDEINRDNPPLGCNGPGTATGLLVWVLGTYLLGRPRSG